MTCRFRSSMSTTWRAMPSSGGGSTFTPDEYADPLTTDLGGSTEGVSASALKFGHEAGPMPFTSKEASRSATEGCVGSSETSPVPSSLIGAENSKLRL
jgi:hypothetical protein